MVKCAYCENPLVCDACEAEYAPPDVEQYDALSQRDAVVYCPACEAVLVCHWCKTPYEAERPVSQTSD